jgi:hypothetical protein
MSMSYDNPRLNLNDSFQTSVIKMSDGNPGALTALMELYLQSPSIDPDDFAGPYGPMMALDVMDIYGSDIYVFFKEVAGHSVVSALGLLRAHQLGYLTETELKRMIAEGQNYKQPDPAVVRGYLARVRESLPNFAK